MKGRPASSWWTESERAPPYRIRIVDTRGALICVLEKRPDDLDFAPLIAQTPNFVSALIACRSLLQKPERDVTRSERDAVARMIESVLQKARVE